MDRALAQQPWDEGTGISPLQLARPHLLPNTSSVESQANIHVSSHTCLTTDSGLGPMSGEVIHVDPTRKVVGPSCPQSLTGRSASTKAKLDVACTLGPTREGE
jgi:hypothetical protein